jgi:nucleotide-binding universal stress UspA family protein
VTTINTTAPVVAGVDGSSTSERALAWAAVEAMERGVSLEIVHAWQMPFLGELPDPVVLEPIPYEGAAQRLLDAAVERVHQLQRSLWVEPRLVRGDGAGALLDASAAASMLVLGSHGRGWLGSALVGSVSQQCVTHAQVPVVVVPAHGDTDTHQGRIVVGIDGSEGSYAALHFAADEAARRHARLDVVHARHNPEHLGPLGAPIWADGASAEKASNELLERMARPFRAGSATHPGPSSIERLSVEGDASRVLVECARGADLLVVGARGHGGFTGLLLGSVSLRCLHHTPCPIAVVHLPAAA